MTDVHTREQRSRNMSAIKGKNTTPELRVRSFLHRSGFRYRLHQKDLPGRPDIVLPRHRVVLFVHGCFWHSHSCRWGAVVPKTRAQFWADKRGETVARDLRNRTTLAEDGWSVGVVWECETKSEELLSVAIRRCGIGLKDKPRRRVPHL
jgi:DNA mismatch endonuclease, patch repair protein